MSRSWYVEHGGRTVGPITSAQLKELATSSRIKRDTRVRLGDDGEWVNAGKVQGLFAPTEIARPKQELAGHQPSPPLPMRAPASSFITVAEPSPTAQTQVVQQKACHFCGEMIAMTAIKCRHCNEFLDGRPREPAPQMQMQPMMASPQPVIHVTQVTNVGTQQSYPQWSPGIAALLSFIVPGLGQLYKGQPINGIVWFFSTIVGYMVFIIPGLVLHFCCVLGAASGNPNR